jgi:co-chaperonin GroES (HSP10)
MERPLPEMMHNRILLAPHNRERKAGRIHIPDAALKSRAEVKACGPGKYLPTGTFIEMRVKPGDIVVLDGTRERECSLLYWGGTEYLVATDDMVICRIDPDIEPEAPRLVTPSSSDIAAPDLQ